MKIFSIFISMCIHFRVLKLSSVSFGLIFSVLRLSGSGGNPFISHSLSWSRKSDISPNGMMYAKVWTPEDPRTSKNGTSFEQTAMTTNFRLTRTSKRRIERHSVTRTFPIPHVIQCIRRNVSSHSPSSSDLFISFDRRNISVSRAMETIAYINIYINNYLYLVISSR